MVKRLFDTIASLMALVALSPVFLIAAVGIRLLSRGPILFPAERIGRNGQPFIMHKFRTMRSASGTAGSAITSRTDSRVFPFGLFLRRLKIDELPQLYDVLRGAMSLVGPRPEDPKIVCEHYTPEQWETLAVRPGLASPGSIYNYTHGEKLIGPSDPERDYVEKLLPLKLALDLVYVREASFCYDLQVIFRSIGVIVLIAMGKREFCDPPEMAKLRSQVGVRP